MSGAPTTRVVAVEQYRGGDMHAWDACPACDAEQGDACYSLRGPQLTGQARYDRQPRKLNPCPLRRWRPRRADGTLLGEPSAEQLARQLIPVGTCSRCRCRLVAPRGNPEDVRPRRGRDAQQHSHGRREWHVVPDQPEQPIADGAADRLPWFV